MFTRLQRRAISVQSVELNNVHPFRNAILGMPRRIKIVYNDIFTINSVYNTM